jgi:hypothetical protein
MQQLRGSGWIGKIGKRLPDVTTDKLRVFATFSQLTLTPEVSRGYQQGVSIDSFFHSIPLCATIAAFPLIPMLKALESETCAPKNLLFYMKILLIVSFLCISVNAQPVRFPQYAQVPVNNPWNPPINGTTSPVFPPGNAAAPWPSSSGTVGSPIYGPATVTPLGPPSGFGGSPSNVGATLRPNSAPLLPPTTGSFAPSGPYAPPTGNGWNLGSWLGLNTYNQPLTAPPANYGPFPNNYPSTVYPNSAPSALFPGGYSPAPNYGATPNYGSYGSTPGQNSLFPNSLFNTSNWRLGNGWFSSPNGPVWSGGVPNPLTSRFFVTPRVRHSWIAGDNDPRSIGINDSDASLVFQIPGFLGSTQPLYVVPSFSSHLWDGPSSPTADLPAAAYSAFLDFGWETNPLQTFGLELGTRVGVFSDYDTFTGQSLRILGKALGRVRLTPTATARIGAYWIDRNRIKLIPAAGILWAPNPDTRFDLFFPEPKLSHYVATLGSRDMWWYVSGYYGGGAWTITRANGDFDNVDLNDMRIAIGLEWGRNELLRQGHRTAFLEGGYVFNRELIYRVRPQDNIDVEDSFMVRAGFAY